MAILELADDLDRSDDDGPWVNGTLTIPSQAVTEAGTYCECPGEYIVLCRRLTLGMSPVVIVTEKQEPSGDDAPTYYVQTYNISVEVTR